MDNPYEVLGVSETATESEIKSAFRERAMECHPDQATHLSDQQAKEEFIRVRKAFDILHDEDLRREFESSGSTNVETESDKYEKEWEGFRENSDEVIDFVVEASVELGSFYLRFFGNLVKYTFLFSVALFIPFTIVFASMDDIITSFAPFIGGASAISGGMMFSLLYSIYTTKEPKTVKAPWVDDTVSK